MQAGQASEVAKLNDEFRRSRGGFMLTQGVRALECIDELILAVRAYDYFSEDNDPYDEHDFGCIDWNMAKVFWKIDYYDHNLQYGLDPLDKDCRRVLTVMLASEY